MICNSCGSKLPVDSVFCTKCGVSLAVNEATQPSPEYAPPQTVHPQQDVSNSAVKPTQAGYMDFIQGFYKTFRMILAPSLIVIGITQILGIGISIVTLLTILIVILSCIVLFGIWTLIKEQKGK